MMWPALWSLNPQITNPHYIYPGDVLFIRPPGVKEEKTSLVWSASRYNETPKNLTLRTRTYGFIAAEDYQESGIIQFSREEKEFLSTYDEVYIEFTTARVVRPGDEYTIYRVERPIAVLDEETEEPVGHLEVSRCHSNSRHLETSCPWTGSFLLGGNPSRRPRDRYFFTAEYHQTGRQ